MFCQPHIGSLQLLLSEETSQEPKKSSPQLPAYSSTLLSPWTGSVHIRRANFSAEWELLLPQNQCPREPSCRRGRVGDQQVGGSPRGLPAARAAAPALPEAALACGWILEAKSPGENSGSTKGNPSGSPKMFPQPREKTLK